MVFCFAPTRITLGQTFLDDEASWGDPLVTEQSQARQLGGAALPNERRIRVLPRNGIDPSYSSFVNDVGERVIVLDGGVNILIYNYGGYSTVDISTDRLVIWTNDDSLAGLRGDSVQTTDVPLEFYMEGNIVFRQGERVIYADRMFYDVRTESGVILDSEMLTPMVGYDGLVRLKAEILQQIDAQNFAGTNSGMTTSRMGQPRYWLQSNSFTFQNVPRSDFDPISGTPQIDQVTGQPISRDGGIITSRGNALFLGSLPVFYWPTIRTSLDKPTYYLNSLSANNDRVFGTQVLTGWDLYQLLGIQNPIKDSEWNLSLDYLSERGFGVGTDFEYRIANFLGRPGHAVGFLDAWAINDTGQDVLGRQRRGLVPEEQFRGRILGRHRNYFGNGYQFSAELGLISDRNFLEAFYEREWDREKDQTTGVELKRLDGNRSWSVTADVQANDFFTQTQWLPRADHFWIGQSILSDWFTWNEHSSIGYANLNVADAPLDPQDAAFFDPLAWERNSDGLRATTRHEISLPMEIGAFKIAPYGLGEAAYFPEDLNGNEVERLFGQTGIRASLPMWKINPDIQSTLFNVNGIAHKHVLEAEFLYADADADSDQLPLYDKLDDDSVEMFRRMFFFDTFGGTGGIGANVPLRFDERSYALRSALQGWTTSPTAEIADDLMAFRLASEHRWQTKRGLPGRQHIVDLVKFDLQGFVYPRADRDNFGQELGLVTYDFEWHPGDRFTVLSDGHLDLFNEGLRTIYLGAVVTRPSRGRYSVGMRSIEGPISSQILFGSTTYRLSEKWIVRYGSSYDFGRTGNLGQNGQIIRVGESFLFGLGFNYDTSRDNFGIRFAIEPRFFGGRLSRIPGISILPTGSAGLE
ncbi:MAG: hypothetical protein KDB27_05850 [Planctomycetales bacterium]|nr:hypothetical protein [Planctomycetales bacterium]